MCVGYDQLDPKKGLSDFPRKTATAVSAKPRGLLQLDAVVCIYFRMVLLQIMLVYVYCWMAGCLWAGAGVAC